MFRLLPALMLAVPLAAVLVTTGCYRGRPPGEAIAAADYALHKAEEDGAGQHAPVILRKAKEKLDAARVAEEEGDNVGAVRRAEQAAVEAQLADATTRNERTRMIEREAVRGIEILREELDRAGSR